MKLARCHLRRLAVLTLGTWLFGLSLGIANACATRAYPAMPASHADEHAVAAERTTGDAIPPNCMKFCSEEVPVVSKAVAALDLPSGQPLLIPNLAVYSPDERRARPGSIAAAPAPPDLPVYLCSLRLAL